MGAAAMASSQVWVVDAGHRHGIAEADHMLELRELAADGLDAIGEFVGDDEHPRTAVIQLVAQVFALVRGVDGNGDGSEPDRGEPGEQHLGGVLDQRGDALAGLNPQLLQRSGEPAAGLGDVARSEFGAADIEIFGVGIAFQAGQQEFGDGVLLGRAPRRVRHPVHIRSRAPCSSCIKFVPSPGPGRRVGSC